MEASSRAAAGPSLPAASRRLLEEFHRTGSFALRTSGKAIAGIVACTVPFLGMFGFSFASPAPMMPVVIGAVFALPLLGVAAWIVRLLVPRVRVVVDREGLLVRGKRVAWAEIVEFRVGVVRTQGTYRFVVAERAAGDSVSLPLLLGPGAARLKPALDVLLAQSRSGI